MITLELAADDVAATRFAISPLHDTVTSLYPMYSCPILARATWVRDARRRPDIHHDLLRSLVSPTGAIPDFVSPAPTHSRPQIDEQLDQIRATDVETVLADIRDVFLDGDLPEPLKRVESDPIGLRDAIADAFARYWQVVISPHWSRMRSILEADLLYRGLQCADLGAGATFAELDPQISWTGGALRIDIVPGLRRYVPASGQVVQLVPSVFMPGPSVPFSADAAPVVVYRARRAGLLWQDMTPVASSAICSLLGRRRASVLAALDQPRSTMEIAHLMSVTPSAVSQHLAVLAAARLVERARVGRVVLYSQSPLARQLLPGSSWVEDEAFDQPGELLA